MCKIIALALFGFFVSFLTLMKLARVALADIYEVNY